MKFVQCLWVLVLCFVVGCGDRGGAALERLAQRGYSLSMEEFGRAAVEGDVIALEWFLEAGVRPDGRDSSGLRAIDRALLAGQDDAAAWLWDHGGADEEAGAAVWKAGISSGSAATVRLLTERSTPPEDADLLLPAVQSRSLDVLELVIELEGTESNASDAIRLAAKLGRVDMVSMLLAAGADVDAVDSETGRTALMEAAGSGHEEVIRVLLKHGANRVALDRSGRSAEAMARDAGHETAARILAEDAVFQP